MQLGPPTFFVDRPALARFLRMSASEKSKSNFSFPPRTLHPPGGSITLSSPAYLKNSRRPTSSVLVVLVSPPNRKKASSENKAVRRPKK